MKRKVFIFNEICPGGNYGIKTYVEQLTMSLHLIGGFETHIVNLRSNLSEFTVTHEENIVLYEIPKERFWKNNQEIYYRNILYLLRTQVVIHELDDIFFQINYFEHKYLISSLRKMFPHGKIIFTLHYLDWSFILQGNTSLFRKTINQIIKIENSQYIIQLFNRDKMLFNSVDIIICLSEYAKNLLVNEYEISNSKIELIHNGLSHAYIEKHLTTKNNLRKQYFFDEGDKIILYVGRLDKAKGGSELIKAFKYVLKKLPKSRLVIIGSGKENIYFEESELYWSKITFTGQIDRSQVEVFYQMADVGVLPSFTEQCSYVAIEMMRYGLPIIGTTSTGLSEMIDDGVNGYKVNIIEKEDGVEMSTKELADKIYNVLKADEKTYAQMSLKCNMLYMTKYHIKQTTDRLIRVFE